MNLLEKSPEFSSDLKNTLELLAGEAISQTITYDYDPLNRLTAADYLGGRFYHYSYDAAGNRARQTSSACTDCPVISAEYVYDLAQRLSSVNGVAYAWDNNGNLLSDGTNTYSYDQASRLTAVSGPSSAVSFGYNGLGDRLRQTVNGVATEFNLDLNNDLAQVLSDGSNSYLYGLGRIGQQNTVDWQYYHGDALGSVRQLSDPLGAVTLARSYEPFGKVLSTAGNPLTRYGYTGEWTDPTDLIYLRARYYDPVMGRFLSKDPVRGIAALPQSLNPYTYAINNPVRYTDPTGRNYSQITTAPPNPNLGLLLFIGVIATGGIVVAELGIIWVEINLAPIAVSTPILGGPLEFIFLGTGVFLIDFDVAYWSYVYQVYRDPCHKHYLNLIPPWGLE